MPKYNRILLIFVSLTFLLITSCNQNDEQRQFEREAISLPENITETNENGAVVEGREDPDDWRIGPYFQGVVSIESIPYPNPLLTNQQLQLELYVSGIDAVSGFRIFVLYNESNYQFLYEPIPQIPGLTSIRLTAGDIARFDDNPEGIYRIIVEDRNGAIITYGDIQIQ